MLRFLAGEAGSGALLILAGAVALLWVNLSTDGAQLYHHLFEVPLGPELTPKLGPMTLHLWINDGLMALFFFVVGLEIKREWLDGRLSTWRSRSLPVLAAIAGMAVPALIYLLVVRDVPGLARGWAIPAATDIAFALAVLALLGSRVPTALKLFLTTVAIVDDIGAVAVIALAYTEGLNMAAAAGAAVIALGLWGLGRAGVRAPAVYLLGALPLWYLVLLSGVHATLAGVLAALVVPLRATPGAPDAADSTLHRLEGALHPWSAYLVLPLFGFANAGVVLPSDLLATLVAPLTLGVGLGLFLGKQIGIGVASALAVGLGVARLPRGTTWVQFYGAALLCGIGFTMSLFIAMLAFPQPELVDEAKIGVLGASLLSALVGYLVLRLAPAHPDSARIEAALAAEVDTDGDTSE